MLVLVDLAFGARIGAQVFALVGTDEHTPPHLKLSVRFDARRSRHSPLSHIYSFKGEH